MLFCAFWKWKLFQSHRSSQKCNSPMWQQIVLLWVEKGSRLHTSLAEVGDEAGAQVVAHHVGGAERRGRTTELLQCSHNASAVFILRGAHHHQLVVFVLWEQVWEKDRLELQRKLQGQHHGHQVVAIQLWQIQSYTAVTDSKSPV